MNDGCGKPFTSLDTGICKHCNQIGVILQASNFDEEACWDCIKSFKVSNPTGLGWC